MVQDRAREEPGEVLELESIAGLEILLDRADARGRVHLARDGLDEGGRVLGEHRRDDLAPEGVGHALHGELRDPFGAGHGCAS